ncbi:nitroreductase family protein [Shewanella surugensis]|uniref:Nitroreductase family protein n=1 Tax=Shewanella surugensis TaxID=212020 RepID=A0ABT0LJ12_9GAMM|nr:nitroreductase family protein [Shewanella surugensis]MCL1127116.1 nitroreductase family protein [Shewanella surugensis]
MALEKQKSFEDSPLWKLKVRLQFSGWLQYIIHAIWALLMWIITGVGWLVGFWPVFLFWLPLGIATFLSISLVGTVLIVKYGMHPTERIPASKMDLNVFDLMRKCHSCRSFQSRNLSSQHHAELMEAVQHHSQQNQQLGQQPVRFEYVNVRLTIWPVVGAHEFLVAIAPREYNRLSIIDVGRSLQKIVLHATRMGMATCWIGPGADQESIIQHLGDKFDPTKDHVICVCAMGYESMFKPFLIRLIQKLQRKRLSLSELFFTDPSFTLPLKTDSPPFNEYGRCYEVCQWSPSSYNGQTTRCAAVTDRIEGEERLIRFDFCSATTSRYYAAVALGIWCANWETGCVALNKRGHFAVLLPEDRGNEAFSDLPKYDVSWVIGDETKTAIINGMF